jgi:hypothetical protein
MERNFVMFVKHLHYVLHTFFPEKKKNKVRTIILESQKELVSWDLCGIVAELKNKKIS